MRLRHLLLACLLSLLASTAVAEDNRYAFVTPAGSRLLAMLPSTGLYNASSAVVRMDTILKQQYISKFTISEERDLALKDWMTFVAQLICSGNVIAAQILVNEIKTPVEQKSALPLLRRFTNEATSTSDDSVSIEVESEMNRIATKFNGWPVQDKTCSTWMLKSAMFGDKIAFNYADKCFTKRDEHYKTSINSAIEMSDIIARYRKGVK